MYNKPYLNALWVTHYSAIVLCTCLVHAPHHTQLFSNGEHDIHLGT